MAIQFDDNGQIERMTQDEFDSEMKAAKERADEEQRKLEALAKAKEEGKVVPPPKSAKSKEAPKAEEKSGTGNMSELRDRLENLRLDIVRLSGTTPEHASRLQAKLDAMALQVDYVYNYVKKGEESEGKKGFFAAIWDLLPGPKK